MKWKRDFGLTLRVWLTMFLLFLVYLVFLSVLLWLGIGLPFIIVIVFLMAFAQYFFSDRLVLMSTRARVIEEDEYPELHRMVEKLAAEAEIPKPRIAIMQTPVPNAFATGRSPKKAVVAVTDSIMRLLSPGELEAVLAHELSHVKNRDVLTLTVASFVAMIAAIIMNNFLFASLFSQRDNNPWIIAGIVAIIVYFIAQLLIMALSRYREFAADRGSAYLTGRPRELISALEKISGRMDQVPARNKQMIESANAFFIIPALSGRTLMELFSTHPPLEKRIANLEKVEMEISGGRGY
ncbi:MAG TPA: zinc metalloprotease HtpX [Methanoregulaceae archaeon]|jgi:heat shock protein HtpX|nr:zinc metalloprotease HtpX [Methanolinea sp.]MDD3091466.1 zinc metalloprotease HtpX [Methanoregulaceae archaeon]HOP66362.1 zinc metalloprotease HtpX [Methanoregulaceae archaeon]HPJ74332.1 zinc metalloprotease HtpX [Methanoregulaceae archaeon]HPQ76178.1 zinc metalloprotease HtpX [Methanoregulaceae archaeon]